MSRLETITEPTERSIRIPHLASADVQASDKVLDWSPQNSQCVGLGYYLQIARVSGCLLLADIATISVAYLFSFAVVAQVLGQKINLFVPFASCVIVANVLSFWSVGLYPAIGLHPAQELKQLVRSVFLTALLLFVALLSVHASNSPYIRMVAIALPIICILLPLARSLSRAAMQRLGVCVPFVFLGSRDEVLRTYRDMTRFGWNVLQPVGRFTYEGEESDFSDESFADSDHDFSFELGFERQVQYLGTSDDLLSTAARENVHWLFIVGDRRRFDFSAQLPSWNDEQSASNHDGLPQRDDLESVLYRAFPHVVNLPSRNDYCGGGNQLVSYGMVSGVRVEDSLLLPGPRLIKRMLDITVSASVLLLLMPLMLAIALLVKLTSPGPILYSSPRIGFAGRSFQAWKIRTMVRDAQEILRQYLDEHPELLAEFERDHKLKDDPRVTWLGRILRKTSLDEIPQLYNVLIGDMSLVGPRPILHNEAAKYGQTYFEYLRVAPGITGLWQISGRNNTDYDERLDYAQYYVQNWTPWLDIYILVRTVRTVLLCEGAY